MQMNPQIAQMPQITVNPAQNTLSSPPPAGTPLPVSHEGAPARRRMCQPAEARQGLVLRGGFGPGVWRAGKP